MAYTTAVVSRSKLTLSIIDYTGSPITNTVTNLVPGSLTYPLIDALEQTEIMIPGTTGKTRYATPVHGKAGGQNWSFQIWADDRNNNTDKNPGSLLKALAGNSTAGTGHSAEVYTSQLTGSGKLQAKFTVTEVDELGNSNVTTLPSIVLTVEDGEADGVGVITVNLMLVGAVTVA